MTQQLLSLVRLASEGDIVAELADDVQRGLTSAARTLPSRYFYDARGSDLFEQITRLPEYYQTRTELQILQHVASDVIGEVAPAQIVELGSGSSRKTRVLLDAMRAAGTGDLYVPVDVSEDALRGALADMTATLPWLRIAGVIGDFRKHLGVVPREGSALVIFLGSTVGNIHPDDQQAFVEDIAAALHPGDAFLLGVDLVPGPRKTVAELEAAYDDAQGVTAAFNRNILSVIGRHLDADINLDDFAHVARYDASRRWIEMLLRARRDLTLRLRGIALDVPLAAGEDIRTEISCKFTREWVAHLFDTAGIPLQRWDTDPDERFALALGRKPA